MHFKLLPDVLYIHTLLLFVFFLPLTNNLFKNLQDATERNDAEYAFKKDSSRHLKFSISEEKLSVFGVKKK